MKRITTTRFCVAAVVLASLNGCGDDASKKQPAVAGDPPPPALIGSWDLVSQTDARGVQDVTGQKIVVTFAKDGKHQWGPVLTQCTYSFKAPDTLKTDCTKSSPGFDPTYSIKSVDATTLVLTNSDTKPPQVNTLKRK